MIKTQIFHKMLNDLKGHWRSFKATFEQGNFYICNKKTKYLLQTPKRTVLNIDNYDFWIINQIIIKYAKVKSIYT